MNRENYEKLETLVKKISENPLSTKSLLKEAPTWYCSNWDERELFEDLINRAKEYLELEETIMKYGSTILNDLEHDKWRELMGWFTELYVDKFKKLKELFLSH